MDDIKVAQQEESLVTLSVVASPRTPGCERLAENLIPTGRICEKGNL